jgi:hypothetical protein
MEFVGGATGKMESTRLFRTNDVDIVSATPHVPDILFTCRSLNLRGSKNMRFIGMSGTLEQSYINTAFPWLSPPGKAA